MFWNESCLTWQRYGNGDRGVTWEEAAEAAHELKTQREREALAESDGVIPAKSLRHRQTLEASQPEGETEETVPRKRKEKKRRRRRRRSPSPDVRAGPKSPRRRRPSSDDDGDRDGGSAKRRSAPEEVWIKVPRSALRG